MHSFSADIYNLELTQKVYETMIAWSGWNRDWTIITVSALLSIAFIPIAWSYLFASGIARWLVTVFTILAAERP